jgi:glycosyltransferase involved in cell wall biosynthesis
VSVSVIVTYHNEGELLRRAIESIERQSYRGALEIIVVDDASEIAPVLPDRCRVPIRVIRSPRNIYAGAARNLGLAGAAGDFIGFLDADDVYLPGKVEAQLAFLAAHPEVLLVGGTYYVHQGERSWLQVPEVVEHCYGDRAAEAFVFPARLRHDICVHYAFNTGQTTFRRRALELVGGFTADYRWGEEWDLLVRLAQRGPIGFLPTPVQRYYQRTSGSISSTPNPEKFATGARMFRDWRRGVAGLPWRYRRRLREMERTWHLLAAQLLLEGRGQPVGALIAALRSLACGPSVWGVRSALRAGWHAVRPRPSRRPCRAD